MSQRKIYRIPVNYKEPGYVFNGMIPTRRFIDMLWLAIVGFFIARILPFNEDNALTGYVFFIAMFALLGFFGIQEVPVSTYLFDLISWSRRRKPYLYNNHGGAYSVTAADVMLNTPGFRDTLADALDKARNAMKSKKTDYVEGETFQFAEDPDLEILAEAERRMKEEAGIPIENPTPINQQKKAPQKAGVPLDFHDISQNIVLHDIEEDD